MWNTAYIFQIEEVYRPNRSDVNELGEIWRNVPA